jgi:hypothetical protein
MALRKETQEADMIGEHRLGDHSTQNNAVGRMPVQRALCHIIVLLLSMAIFLSPHVNEAFAAETSSDAASASCNDDDISLCLLSTTAVVTNTSGFDAKISITNNTDDTLSSGTLNTSTNALYPFTSRVDMQGWSEGNTHIPTPNTLNSSEVPSLQAGATTTISIHLAADSTELKVMTSWGPKPLLLSYSQGQERPTQVHSFLTRSADGLSTAQTPALSITAVFPLTSSSWNVDEDALSDLVTKSGESNNQSTASPAADTQSNSTTSTSVLTLNKQAKERQQQLMALLNKHPQLQSIADPNYLSSFAIPPQTSALMQPADFDITAYSQGNAESYTKAGITTKNWDTAAGLASLRAASGDAQASAQFYAWQGQGAWTLAALESAKQAGYSTVIADSDYEANNSSVAHTGKYVVTTKSGTVTVLAAQRELSRLAQGKSTSSDTDGESTDAGRLARFMAQSALYQMEQPYANRVLMVTFSESNQNLQDADALMTAMEHASWIKLTDLQTLDSADAYQDGSTASSSVPSTSGISSRKLALIDEYLGTLASTQNDIVRFGSAILVQKKTGTTDDDADPSPASDTQALARGDASTSASQQNGDATAWLEELKSTQVALALHTFNGTGMQQRFVKASSSLSSELLNGVSITPSESISVVSETASMPVTISNDHPYPVTVSVSSQTDSTIIATSRLTEATVPANSEVQVTFTIRVATSGEATTQITLLDRNGEQFGSTQSTRITSSLQLSDKSGLVLLAVGILFGALGLWRQFTRKKDADE